MKKFRIATAVMASACLLASIPACGGNTGTNSSSASASVVSQVTQFTENDLKGILDIPKIYVLQGSENLSFEKAVEIDGKVVTKLAVESSELDTSKTGSFAITYIATVDLAELAQYLKLDDASDMTGTQEIRVNGNIDVITEEEAQEILAGDASAIILRTGNEKFAADGGEADSSSSAEGQEVDVQAAGGQDTVNNAGSVNTGSENRAGDTKTGSTATGTASKNTGSTGSGNTGTASGSTNKGSSTNTGSTGSSNKTNTGSTGSAGNTGSTGSSNKGNSSNTGSSGNTGSTGSSSNKGNSSNTGSSGSTGSSTGTGSSGSTGSGSSKPAHTHDWQPVYTTVHHDEVGHYEEVVVKAAYDEPVYEGRYVCSECGYVTKQGGDAGVDEIADHGDIEHDGAAYSTIRVQVGTKHHEAEKEQKYVVDTAAYDEQIVSGYKCSCGATK